ncbi:MAG: diguanylate cyclase [Candidatus Aminicenantales bacterium]
MQFSKKIDDMGLASFLSIQEGLVKDRGVWLEKMTIKHQDKVVGELILGFSLSSIIEGTKRVRRIVTFFALFVFLAGGLLSYYLSALVTRPLRQIIATVSEIAAGDHSRRVGVNSKDELGQLASSFNQMLDRLEETMRHLEEAKSNLEKRVTERTAELAESVSQLELRNKEINWLFQMSDSFQMAQNEAEIVSIAVNYARRLFPAESGAIYLKGKEGRALDIRGSWGDKKPRHSNFFPEDCWALRKGQAHMAKDPEKDIICPHLLNEAEFRPPSLCVPLVSFGESLGVFVINCCSGKEEIKEPFTPSKSELEILALQFTQRLSTALSAIRLREFLKEQSIRDPLTGLYNRRFLEETFERELLRARRAGNMVAVMMLDIDHFKKFNDLYGHDAGDEVLVALARIFQKSVRREDVVCRYGGEEFTIIMPVNSLDIARSRAELILDRVHHLEIFHNDNVFRNLTVSIGLASFPENGETAEVILSAADEALLEAKKKGGNRIVLASELKQAAKKYLNRLRLTCPFKFTKNEGKTADFVFRENYD